MDRVSLKRRQICTTPSTSSMSSEVEDVKQGNKPEMERRRRARMNEAFEQLKKFHLMHSPNQPSKLEKSDVLELTVDYLRKLHENNESTREDSSNEVALEAYREGFRMAGEAAKSFVQYALPPPQAAILNVGLAAVLANNGSTQPAVPPKHVRKRDFFSAFPDNIMSSDSSISIPFVRNSGAFPLVCPVPPIRLPVHFNSSPVLCELDRNVPVDERRQTVACFEHAHRPSKEATSGSGTTSIVCVICEGKCRCKR
ncbi:Transcription factor HES-1 [Toxocara canis]|uniref:Transcription factor HES-1 n=1 Tax=Toxocara canis TaxID=6265 RepID=A0A0B2W2B3_TOXCA|nr:Transcription factor HES-1 [Toxocara canis]